MGGLDPASEPAKPEHGVLLNSDGGSRVRVRKVIASTQLKESESETFSHLAPGHIAYTLPG